MTAQDQIDELHARGAEEEDIVWARLLEALASCQIIESQLQRGGRISRQSWTLVEAIDSYVEAWMAGTSRKEAWEIEDA